jgi:hypothetical protein
MALFSTFRASLIKQAKLDEVVAKVRGLSDDMLLSLNDEEFIEAQVEEHHVEVPVLDYDAEGIISYATGDIEVRDYGESKTVRGALVKFTVPFNGTKDVFHWQADSVSYNPPDGQLFNNTVWFTIAKGSLGGTEIARVFSGWRDEAEKQLNWHRGGWANFDDEVRQTAKSTISNCRARAIELRDAANEAAALLGLRVRVREDDPQTFVAPAIRKKIEVSLPRTSQKKVSPPDPSLARKIYDDIVRVLVGAGTTLERSGAALRSQDEETLRDILMLPLNSHFEGLTHGEAFNKEGKTDIIVRFEQATLFVAECKVWGGPKVLSDAIDQLFKYLTWKDSKAAIIVFNRNVDFTNVLAKCLEAAKAHPQFGGLVGELSENVWELQFKLPSDAKRLITVTLMAFDMGAPANK